ncbi:hypothetical protein F53441_8623 [Fusarium austroafricanum]|uniref:BTB domain-containing protein n=1 Tax=Fusarium austroafricanum TaxID=2364996 RepID=A0A8H4NWC5_9HYPO|nr:hypothetical protein F53441_8623 [Fusarium austroafricanum]
MTVIKHDIDPDGDVEIVLKDHGKHQTIPEVRVRKGTEFPLAEAPVVGSPILSDLVIPKDSAKNGDSQNKGGSDSNKEPIEIRIRVSSHQLSLVSPVFKKMLQGPFKEGTSPTSSSEPPIQEISASDWNVHALVIVLYIIHGRQHLAPQRVSLRFLVDVAVIVDYYDCANSVCLVVQLWDSLLPENQRNQSNTEFFILRLYISWVFSLSESFSRMAAWYLRTGQGIDLVETYDLPVAAILAKLDLKRRAFINEILTILNAIAKQHRLGKMTCKIFECRAMVYGSMQIGISEMKSANPLLDSPLYKGYSVADVISLVKQFPHTNWRLLSQQSAHQCSVRSLMAQTFTNIEKGMGQSKLSDFQHERS